MPLKQGSSPETMSYNLRELHQGKQFARTKRKFGKAKARKQAIAIALDRARQSPDQYQGVMRKK
jgi:hypothetical protein